MAENAFHTFGSTTRFGLTQALHGMENIYVISLEASPAPGSPDFSEIAGAFVNVYAKTVSESEALRIASAEIADAQWIVLCIEEQYLLSQDEANGSPEVLSYYTQALNDGVVLVFHNYPHGGDEFAVPH